MKHHNPNPYQRKSLKTRRNKIIN